MSKHLLEEFTKSKRARAFVKDLTKAGVSRARSELLAKKLMYLAEPESFGKRVGRHYTFKSRMGGKLVVVKTPGGVVIKGPNAVKIATKARPKSNAKSVRRHK